MMDGKGLHFSLSHYFFSDFFFTTMMNPYIIYIIKIILKTQSAILSIITILGVTGNSN